MSQKRKSILDYKISDFFKVSLFGIDKLFLLIVAVNVVGAFAFQADYGSQIIIPIVIGCLGYCIGLFLGRLKLSRRRIDKREAAPKANNIRIEYMAICAVFIISLILGFSVFTKGIPLFSPFDNAIRSSLGDGTQGRIRFLITGLPMATVFMFLFVLKYKEKRNTFIVMAFITLIGFALYTYKAYILWFAITLFYVYYYYRKSNGLPLKLGRWILIGFLSYCFMMLVFSLWLNGNNTGTTSLLTRIVYDELSGFDYIYRTYIPSHGLASGSFISQELASLLGVSTDGYSFAAQLANLYYGQEVTWGIVATIYGFFYIDFGNPGVFFGLLLFGFLVRKLDYSLTKLNTSTTINATMELMLISVLGYIFQNGTVFNEIRGTVLSIIIIKIIYEISKLFIEYLPSNRRL